MEQKLIDNLLRYRYWWALLSLVLTFALTAGGKNLFFETDYKIYFNDDDPHLLAHEDMEDTYTKTDNLGIYIKPKEGSVFTPENMALIYKYTEEAWQTPYAIRVDSLTNFQHTSADGDDLTVADLVLDPELLDEAEVARIREIALSEKQLVNRVVARDGKTTLINVSLELPPGVDPTADKETQAEQRLTRDSSYPEVVDFGEAIKAGLQQDNPDLEVHLIGVPIINYSFSKSGERDFALLVPVMYGVIVVLLLVFLRSIGAIVGTVLLIGSASAAAIGTAGWLGFSLNTVNITAPTIILTIAVCDAVHLLAVYLRNLGLQMPPLEAMRESLRLNLQPIVLTSITTAVGFFTLNFSNSPPFRELGTISGIGVLWAMVLTFTLLPTLSVLLARKRKPIKEESVAFARFSGFVVGNRNMVITCTLAVALVLVALVPLNKIDDDPSTYFKPGVPYRDATDFLVENLPSIQDFNFSIDCGAPGCVNDPEFLAKLAGFGDWAEQQPGVEYVSTYVDVMRRLNRSMNGDDQSYYRLPEQAELSAQYNLMYEMSLPYGLDLNNQVNIDKSATRVSIFTTQISTGEFIVMEEEARRWFQGNHPELESPGSSVFMMFAHVGEKNIRSMMVGAVVAIIGVTLTILIALRSFRYAFISMVPNVFPALMAFGVWGVMVGQVNMAVAAVFSIALGILVDDTVHFISKYRRAREVKGFSPEKAIEYAFNNVGPALVITTLVLVSGFSVLNLSDFNLNAMTGMLTATTIGIALIFDFLILPPILIMFDKDKDKELETDADAERDNNLDSPLDSAEGVKA
ncbi:MAG: MMPL family transporter [Pseudomonadota bacterium]